MRAWVGVLVLAAAACGRSGFEDVPPDAPAVPDRIPDPVDWPDFGRASAAVPITGINEPIELTVQGSVASGSPTLQYRVDAADFVVIPAGTAVPVQIVEGNSLQFRVQGAVGDAGFFTITNASSFDALLDTTKGTVTSMVTGAGTSGSPYVAPAPVPHTCAEYLAGYGEQAGRDGVYQIELTAVPMTVWCDMTTDRGGWTLVARVLGTSTTHTTLSALGVLTDPVQTSTAKLEDAKINTMSFSRIRIAIEGVGTVYASRSKVNFNTAGFSVANSAAPALDAPYVYTFKTQTGCSSDCGVSIAEENMGFGARCGYRYWVSSGNPRPGMGCKDNNGKAGTAWIR